MSSSFGVATLAYIGNLLGLCITKFGLFLQKLTLIAMEKEGSEDRKKIKPAY